MKILKNIGVALVIGLGCVLTNRSAAQNNSYDIIPYPSALTAGQGVFTITDATKIDVPAGKFANEVVQLNELIQRGLGTKLKLGKGAKTIKLILDASLVAEGYKLTITPGNVAISAATPAGMFRAVETIRQLLPVSLENKTGHLKALTLPALNITDQPEYAWRGMHLDVSRHFFSISYLHKFIDLMALYKMNKFHLHLTDDQGWRVEIKKYPLLTQQGAWRTFNNQDSACMKKAKDNPDFEIDKSHIIQKDGKTLYGGYYTQEQLKELVAYAATKHIEIIPEIDMPGHMMAAITAYPYLTCNGENKFGELFSKPICPCNESTYQFAQNVFDEIMQIFPSQYIHIGGDEVDRTDWAKSAECKAMMEREGIKDLAGLHSYFINRMEKYFNSKGKKLIGWDEVIEGGISPTATIMYWRTWVPDAPVKAAKNGNKVIMTPGEPLYFDNPADQYSLYKVYHFNPIPAKLNKEEAKTIIGAQANIWTEMIPSERRADYMMMPRMTALAERLWNGNADNYDSYLKRLTGQYKRLDALNVHYRLPDIPNIVNENVFTDKAVLTITKPLADMTIRYTTDGSLPQNTSNVLPTSLTINKPVNIKLAAFTPNGSRGDIYTINYRQQSLAAAVSAQTTTGLKCDYYKAFFKQTSMIEAKKPDSSFIANNIIVPASVNAPSFALIYKGYIDVPQTGIYTFYLTCDDGGILKIADRMVVDNDGLHSAQERNGQVALAKGLQPFLLKFIEGGGGFALKLKYSFNGSAPAEVPSSWFKN
ncbi:MULTISPECIES: family 20 glycosylhydrolase [unclassified Mucilaginibacter]|uniref:family 20 glycosylhydrolase n=1 Tax=unclassified Mucilaginibacter TaxID=2617802 RepID=UPI000960DA8A|nr:MULTISPECIES: family 20 glycosylhydrolase [unclassified Mucilaginibacter]OJW18165.1 MAG: beta-hexosaminidase [Mucilaginibacter sp. 44-25]PLW89730.1 MAG: beta-hexosaminidase [Mucilaginibacter sp.]PMP66005.1 MAG: beta-hexosaminidase [Mucilaginibacter sp.]HEK22340.1 beta-hexosaminidase [Bacteroidota bacterium]